MTTPIDPVPAPTGRPWIWLEPHQDDKLLWAGQIAAHHALVGREMHVVCASDGSTSRIRYALNGEEGNGWWGGFHFPDRELIPAPISPAEFAAARDRELVNASVQLGIRQENIHLELDTRGSTLSVAQAEALMRRYQDQYPDAGMYTTHWLDPDPTHAALGQALRNLRLAEPDKFTDCRWVIRRSQIGKVVGAVEYVVPTAYKAQVLHMTKCAARAYGAWAPLQNLFAIGYHSVPADFAAVERGDANWYVKQP